jgi:hypothetical protein
MACCTSEIGDLRRKVIPASSRWQEYPKRVVGLTDVHSTRILNPVSCYPLP